MILDRQIIIEGIPITVVSCRGHRTSIRVDKRSGEVKLSVPTDLDRSKAMSFVRDKLHWIRKPCAQATTNNRRTEPIMPELYVSGEWVTFLGKVYNLVVETHTERGFDVMEQADSIRIVYNPLVRRCQPEILLRNWMFGELFCLIESLTKEWEQKLGVKCSFIKYRQMKSRWGSCNYDTATITYNTNLICFPTHCVEYIVVHELAHLIEPNHSPAFHRIIDQHLPDWRLSNKRLSAGYPNLPSTDGFPDV